MSLEFRQRCDVAAEGLGRTSLVARLSEAAGEEAIIQALESGRPRLGTWAARELAALPDAARAGVVERSLDGTVAVRIGMLRVLAASAGLSRNDDAGRTWPDAIQKRVESDLEHPDLAVRVAAARCLARHAPERLPDLVPTLERDGGSEVVRMFCLSGNEALIRPLVEYSGRRLKSLPPSLGWLVTPAWLARTRSDDLTLSRRLVETFGYCDAEPTDLTWELLAEGWSYVSTDVAKPLFERTDDRRRMTRALVPTGLATCEPAIEADAYDPLWQTTLIAAVRDADRSNLEEFLERNPFDSRVLASPQIAVAMHAPVGYLRRIFLEEPLREAERLEIPQAGRAEFLVDAARVALETIEEPRAELQMATLAKWRARVRLGARAHHMRIERFPILTDEDAPDLKSVVLGRRLPTRLARKGSPGMESISRMAIQAGLADPSPILAEAEQVWEKVAPTVGMELQVPSVDRDVSICWKQALRFLGTPSPRRPEYFQTVEASFPPARAITTLILGPLLLLRLGLIAQPLEMALHISVGGDLGDQANDLAFLLYFIAMGKPHRVWPTGMKWVLSKGLVHFHPEAEQLGETNTGRTEVRVLRCIAAASNGTLKLQAEYIDQAVATALLATALLSTDEKLKAISESFHRRLAQVVDSLPAPFRTLRESSFYDSTGDGTDPEWLGSLPIVRNLTRVRESLQAPGVRDRVEEGCRRLRNETAASIAQELGLSGPPAAAAERDVYRTSFGLPLFIPAELQELLTPTSC